jgi:LysM repeat protein
MALSTSPGHATGYTKTESITPGHPPITRVLFFTLLLLVLSLLPLEKVFASPFAEAGKPTVAQVIEAVNALRIDNGLDALSVHTALMQAAQTEAEGIANGMPGHWRPYGLTLGQWLISLGYPLAGDLSQDGYRSENWLMARNAEEAIQAWTGDGEHSNTMLSPDRSDIGVGIAASDDVYIIVLVTALQTGNGAMQSAAYPLLTQVSSSNSGAGDGSLLSQYMKPVALNTARPDGDVIHKIQYGQSLWSIAVAYHTTIEQIRAWNNLWEATTVYEGEVLLVQKGATQPPPATPTPRASITPLSTAIARRAIPSSTVTVPRSPMSPGENAPSPSLSLVNLVGLVLVLFALGGLIAVWWMQR